MSEELDIKQLIKEHKPLLRDSSIHNYILSVNKLKKKNEIDGYTDFVKRPKTIIKYLRKMGMSKNTEKNYTSAIINVVDALNNAKIKGFTKKRYSNCIKCYRKHIYDLRSMVDVEMKERDGAMTEKEKQNYITFEEVGKVHKVYDKIIKEGDILKHTETTPMEKDMLQKWVLSGLYAYLPPIRNEYATLNIVDREYENGKWTKNMPRDKNYLLYYKKQEENDEQDKPMLDGVIDIQMNQYKTSRKHGSRTLRIYPGGTVTYVEKDEQLLEGKKASKLWKMLWSFKTANPTAKYLFYNKKGKQMSRNDMTKYLYATFKILFPNKNISSNILRKSFHTSREAMNPIKKQYQKSKVIAEAMGHTIDEALHTYTKDEAK